MKKEKPPARGWTRKQEELIKHEFFKLIKEVIEEMANQEDLKNALGIVETSTASLITEMTAAFARLLAKIAAGVDTQAEIDRLNLLNQQLTDATNQAKVEGL